MLDIHDDTGQPALEAAGLTAELRGLVLEGREATRVLDRDGRVLLDQPDDPAERADGGMGRRPEVQRGELRRILVDSLPAGTVRWGRKVSGVRALGGGRHAVDFADGSTVATDLLVGADGAWSRVRPLLSDAVPEYVGTSFYETWLFDADTRHAHSAETVGGGALFALSPRKGIVTHREAGGTLHTYAALAEPRDREPGAAAAGRIAQEFDGWAPELTALITDGDTTPVRRTINTLPAGHRWDRVPGVTLVGDAAHLMPPSGEGANLAMYDGAELGRAIAAHPRDVEAALAEYERTMFPRSAAAADDAAVIFDLCYGDDAPRSLVDFLAGHTPAS
jgi:2-polyprenyl-6-methoxyphenol hydroxylase-like FAD-dependent oxidoreductase